MKIQRARRSKPIRVPGTSRHEKLTRVPRLRSHSDLLISLDESTSKLLTQVSRRWHVSQLEALRRALEVADSSPTPEPKLSRRKAFHELQKRLNLTPAKATEWQDAIRESRR